MLPQSLVADLCAQLAYSHSLWQRDRAQQVAGVELPHALERKYPRAPVAFRPASSATAA